MTAESAVHFRQALALERSGRAADAVAEYREAARVDPVALDAHLRLGLLLRALGRDEEANRAFLAALEVQRRAAQSPWARRACTPPDLGP